MKRRASSVALEAVLRATRDHAAVNVSGVMYLTGYKSGTAKRALAELVEQGKVERVEPGFYRRAL